MSMSSASQSPFPAAGTLMPDLRGKPFPLHIGIDIGKVHDPTAYVVAEVVQRATGHVRAISERDVAHVAYARWVGSGYVEILTETAYLVHTMRRIPVGLDYTAIAGRLAEVICARSIQTRRRTVWLDVTGVGRSVFDHVRAIIAADPFTRNVDLWPTSFTSGRSIEIKDGEYRVGKEWFVSRLTALVSPPTRIKMAEAHPEAPAMFNELMTYDIKLNQETGHGTFGALRPNTWDDLATALGLSVMVEDDIGPGYIPFDAEGWR